MNFYEPLNNFEIIANNTYVKELNNGDKITVVTIKAPDGKKYTGTAKIDFKDMKYFRYLTGYKIAETRAYIHYLKYTVKKLGYCKYSLKELISKHYSFIYSNKEKRDTNHKIVEISKAIKEGKETITKTYKLMNMMIEERWKVVDKIDNRAEALQKRQDFIDAIRAGQNSLN